MITFIPEDIRAKLAFRRLFATDDGKLVLKFLCKRGFISQSTFVQNDPHQTALNEGTRRLVLSILRYANSDPQTIIDQIEQENHARSTTTG